MSQEDTKESSSGSRLLGGYAHSNPPSDQGSASTTTYASGKQREFLLQVKATLRLKSRKIEEAVRAKQARLHFEREESDLTNLEREESEQLKKLETCDRKFALEQLSTELQERAQRKELKVMLSQGFATLKEVQFELSHQAVAQSKFSRMRDILRHKRREFEERSRLLEEQESKEMDDLRESHMREARNLESWNELDTMFLKRGEKDAITQRGRLLAEQVKEKQQQEMQQQRELQIQKSKFVQTHFDAELVFVEDREQLLTLESVASNDLARRQKRQKKALKAELLMAREMVRREGQKIAVEMKAVHIQDNQKKKAKELEKKNANERDIRKQQFTDEEELRHKEFLELLDEEYSECETMSSAHQSQHSSKSSFTVSRNPFKKYIRPSTRSATGSDDSRDLEHKEVTFQGMTAIGEEGTKEQAEELEVQCENQAGKLEAHNKRAANLIANLLEKHKTETEDRKLEVEKAVKDRAAQWEALSANITHEHESEMLSMRKQHAARRAEMEQAHQREMFELDRSLEVEDRVRKEVVDDKVVSSQAKSEFLSFVCHELRNPLSGVLAISDMILSGSKLKQEIKDQVATLKKEADNMNSIVNDVLDFAKIEANKLVLDPVDFNFTDTVTQLAKSFRNKLDPAKVTLRCNISPKLPSLVNADPVRLTQVMSNLLSNAVKFTKSGTVDFDLNLDGTLDEGTIRISCTVKDTGIGIIPEHLPHIFSAFSQANPSATRSHGGSGLGLGITKALVEKLGGTIGVTSNPNKGSTFRFTFLSGKAAQGSTQSTNRKESGEFKTSIDSNKQVSSVSDEPADTDGAGGVPSLPPGLKVLVVEDSPTLLRMWANLVGKMGCDVDTASDGQAALSKCDDTKYDVIITDISMPKLSGDKLVKQLRQAGWTCVIIALTAADGLDVDSCCKDGFNCVLSKPFQVLELRDVIVRELGTR